MGSWAGAELDRITVVEPHDRRQEWVVLSNEPGRVFSLTGAITDELNELPEVSARRQPIMAHSTLETLAAGGQVLGEWVVEGAAGGATLAIAKRVLRRLRPKKEEVEGVLADPPLTTEEIVDAVMAARTSLFDVAMGVSPRPSGDDVTIRHTKRGVIEFEVRGIEGEIGYLDDGTIIHVFACRRFELDGPDA